MSGIGRRAWRHLSGYYNVRRSDLLHTMVLAEVYGDRRYLDELVAQIGRDGDMQRVEYLLLQTMEVTE